MVTTTAAAENIKCRLSQGGQVSLDPATIAIIIEVIKLLLPLVLELCRYSPGQVPKVAKEALDRKGMTYRIARRWVRRELGWQDYHEAGGDVLLDAVLLEATEADEEIVAAVYRELF